MLLGVATKQQRVCDYYRQLRYQLEYTHTEAMISTMNKFKVVTQTEFNTYLAQGGVFV